MPQIDPLPHGSAARGTVPVRPSLLATMREFGTLVAQEARASLRVREPASLPKPCGSAALVVPTLLRGDGQTAGLRAALCRGGHAAVGWGLGSNLGPTARLMAGVEARLLSLAAAHGPVDLVGLSMGGLFCRWLALRHPERVRQVVTVCSPFRAPLDSAFLPLRPVLPLWRTPGLLALAEQVAQPLPVPGTFLYSEQDGIVAWESCLDERFPADCFRIDGPHVAIAANALVRSIVLQRLARRLPSRSQ